MSHAAGVYQFGKTCYANLGMKISAPRLNSSPLTVRLALTALAAGTALAGGSALHAQSAANELLKGRAAMGDWTTDAPGVRRLITVDDLPLPNATPSSDKGPHMVPRPAGVLPKAPPGFEVDLLAEGLTNPRKIV